MHSGYVTIHSHLIMATLPEVVRQSELLNQLVLTRSTMEELGRVEVLWMYPQAHRVLGFVCKAGFLGHTKLAFKLAQVEAIGANGILTHSQPDATDAERVRQLETLIHCEVWSNAGHKLGKLIDCEFNLRSGVIVDYLLVSDRFSELAGSIYRLPPAKILSFGKRRILVAETSTQALDAYRKGISQRLSKVSHALKEESSQVTQELRSLAKRAQETTLHTTAQLKTLAEQARERAQFLAEQATEKAQDLNEQLWERAETLVEQAKETGETLIEQLHDPAELNPSSWRESPHQSARRTAAISDDEIDAIFDFDEFDDDRVDQGAVPPDPENPDHVIIEEIENVLEEIEEFFGVESPPTAADHPEHHPRSPAHPSPLPHPATDQPSSSWDLDDETPWSQDKLRFVHQSHPVEPWDFDEDDDPWNITELPAPSEPVSAPTDPLQLADSKSIVADDDHEPWI